MEPPPYKNKKARRVASCWVDKTKGSSRTIYIDKNVLDSRGYWKH